MPLQSKVELGCLMEESYMSLNKLISNNKIGQLHLLLLATIVAISTMANSVVTPLLPIYARQLLTPVQIGVLVSVFGFVRFITQPFLGMLSDRWGHRKSIQVMLILFAISGLGYAVSNTFLLLILFRSIQAIAVGGLSVSVRSYIIDVTTKETRGQVNGIVSSMQNTGSFMGPVAGGILADWWDIHAPFYMLSVVLTFCLLFSVKLPLVEHNRPASNQYEPIKTKLPQPLILISIINVLEFAGLGIWLTVWPIYAVENLGWTSSMVGISFSISALAGLLTAPIWGKISDQYGRTVSAITGLVLLTLQPISVLLFDNSLFILLIFAVAGVGGTGYFNAHFTLIGDLVPTHKSGWVQGSLNSASQLGNSAGSLVAPILWEAMSIQFPIVVDVILLVICTVSFVPLLIKEKQHNQL